MMSDIEVGETRHKIRRNIRVIKEFLYSLKANNMGTKAPDVHQQLADSLGS